MREIKFRAWDGIRNEWIEVADLIMESSGRVYAGDINNPPMVRIENKNVVFYTGLKDKNGVEIYEGDIVQRTYESGSKHVGEVVFEEATYFLRNSEDYAFLSNQYDHETLQIVGNIYEHPHLLENNQ